MFVFSWFDKNCEWHSALYIVGTQKYWINEFLADYAFC